MLRVYNRHISVIPFIVSLSVFITIYMIIYPNRNRSPTLPVALSDVYLCTTVVNWAVVSPRSLVNQPWGRLGLLSLYGDILAPCITDDPQRVTGDRARPCRCISPRRCSAVTTHACLLPTCHGRHGNTCSHLRDKRVASI